MTDLEFLNLYRKMKHVTDLCKETGIHNSNLIAGLSTKENEKTIATLCKLEIVKYYNIVMQEEIKKNAKTSSL